MIRILSAAMAILSFVSVVDPALAAGPKTLGSFGKWSAHLVAGNSGKTCYVHGEPETSKGKYKRRDETYIQVSHRTTGKVKNEIGVTAGYAYRPESDVEIDIDGKPFTLFTAKDSAWMREKKDEARMVAAMKAGRIMVVRGTSSRGTLTTDTYLLKGFTAAYTETSKACGIK